MSYFVTGATGFIGRFLVDKLIAREGPIYVLVRKGSVKKLDQLRARWGAAEKRVIAVVGDLAKPRLGLSPGEIAKLQDTIRPLYQFLDFRFSLVELDGCLSEQLNTLFEQLERLVQVEFVAVQLRDNLLEALQVGFEGHGR